MKKQLKKSQHIQLYKGMSIYKRPGTPFFWGYLRISGKAYKKSLGTSNKFDAEKQLFDWKSQLLNDFNITSLRSFKFWAEKFIELQKDKPIPSSGQSPYLYTKKSLNRKRGLIEFFGHKSVDAISRFDILEFYNQMPITTKGVRQELSTSYMRKHRLLLSQILEIADRTTHFKIPNPKGIQSQRRGFFTKDEYQTLRDSAKSLVGKFSYTSCSGSTYTLTEDVHNAMIFLMGTMLRPTINELMTIRFRDIQEKKSKQKKPYLFFTVQRKNQMQGVESLSTAYYHYQKMKKDADHNDFLFMNQYQNRKTALSMLSKMFIELLKHTNMSKGRDGEKRTLYSLRHSAIIFNLQQVDRTDVEKRADTSPEMISNWYYPQSQLEDQLDDYLR